MDPQWYQIGYLISATFFIFGLKMLGHPRTAPRGNQMGAIGMLLAVVTVILEIELIESPILIVSGILIGTVIGSWLAIRVEMTGMPELVALFNGFGGAASALVALAEIYSAIEAEPYRRGGASRCLDCDRPFGTSRLDDPDRFSRSALQAQGWIQHPWQMEKIQLGPSWLNPSRQLQLALHST